VKTHFDRTLLDTNSESRAWILGLTYVGIVVAIGLSGMHLLQKPSRTTNNAPPAQKPLIREQQPSIETPSPAIPKQVPDATPKQSIESAVVTKDATRDTTPVVPPSTPTIDPKPALIPDTPPKTATPDNKTLPRLETQFAPPSRIQADSFFNNTLVRIYRQKHPDDPMTNRELTETMGDHYKIRGTFIPYAEKFPDWAQHYHMIKKEKGEQ
jgi:hypothetical protein